MLIQIAMTARNNKKDDVARVFLEEAHGLIAGRAENHTQFHALLQVAQAYGTSDPSRSFAIVESAIDRLNELLAAAVVLDGFGQEAFRDGELRPSGGYMWNEMVRQCGEELARLAPADFERASAAAGKFERSEVRAMARLMVARGALQSSGENGRGHRVTFGRGHRGNFVPSTIIVREK